MEPGFGICILSGCLRGNEYFDEETESEQERTSKKIDITDKETEKQTREKIEIITKESGIEKTDIEPETTSEPETEITTRESETSDIPTIIPSEKTEQPTAPEPTPKSEVTKIPVETTKVEITPTESEKEQETVVQEITIFFEGNGGDVEYSQVTVKAGDSLGKLPNATRDYYSFDGWFSDQKVTEETVFTGEEDITLSAHWSLNPEENWTLYSEIPDGCQITDEKWTYTLTEEKEAISSPGDGWTEIGHYGRPIRTYTYYWANYPAGFDEKHELATKYNKTSAQIGYTTHE